MIFKEFSVAKICLWSESEPFLCFECMKKPSVNFLFSEIFWYVEFSESKKVKKIHCTFVAREFCPK